MNIENLRGNRHENSTSIKQLGCITYQKQYTMIMFYYEEMSISKNSQVH